MELQLILVAASLSIDALGVGCAYGIRNISVKALAKVTIFLVTLFFSALSALAGIALSRVIEGGILKILGVGILVVLGAYIIKQSINDNEKYDRDHSKSIDAYEGIYLGAAISLDSVGAGVACVALGFSALSLPFVIASSHVIFLCLGLWLGKRLSGVRVKKSLISISSGVMIIVLGLLRLF